MNHLRIAHGALAVGLALTCLAPAAASATARPGTLDGIWRADGYSTLFRIDQHGLAAFDTTSISCLPGLINARRLTTTPRTSTFSDARIGREITVRANGHDRARLSYLGAAGRIELRRSGGLPQACTAPAPSDPLRVFDVFWTTFAENYPFFATRGIDWRAVRDRHRATIHSETTDEQLFNVLRGMLQEIGDAHTALNAGQRQFARPLRPGTRQLSGLPDFLAFNQRLTRFIERHAVKKPLRTWAQGAIGYADLPGGIGYLRLVSFNGYTRIPGYAADAAELDRALDEIFTRARTSGPQRLRGLVLDIRLNLGGFDQLGLKLAERLATRPYLAYAKQAFDRPGFTPAQSIRVKPAAEPRHTGPIALLTSPLTISAGETFTQAMMGRTPEPRRIGENTQGAFSDFLWRSLPNGWSFALPNERFLTHSGRSFDVTGIPAHWRVPDTLSDEELASDRDRAFEQALTWLRNR